MTHDAATVHAVSRAHEHAFSKRNERCVRLLTGHGVEGDAHAGHTVQHRSRVARDPDLLGLPTGTALTLGPSAVVEITGLRNPCVQLDRFQAGLMGAVLDRDARGGLIRKAGVMAVVVAGGDVRPGDAIDVALPPRPHTPLAPV